jgi:hypothetical protein
VLAVLAACGTEPDTRPETADDVITAVLEPKCGRAGCHTSDTAPHELVFDTIPHSLDAFGKPCRDGGTLVLPSDVNGSCLYTVVVDTNRPMPPDRPLANADVDLIKSWIAAGAPGYTP